MIKDNLLDILNFGYPLNGSPISLGMTNTLDSEPFSYKRLRDCFLSECEKLLGGDDEVLLPLSGGLDSRLILALLLELLPAKKIHAFTYGTEGQLDFEIPPIIAAKTGINFQRVNYSEVSISSDIIMGDNFTLDTAPTHNIIGFNVTKAVSQKALGRLGVSSKVPVWSGFLGDRVFSGMWSDSDLSLDLACNQFVDSYTNRGINLSGHEYQPVSRLNDTYRGSDPCSGINWSERIELEQRQQRVKSTLKTLKNKYKFLFLQPDLLSFLVNTPSSIKSDGKLQKEFCLKYFPDLFSLPVTSNFGAPLRKFQFQHKLDRYKRLSASKIDLCFNTNLEKFKRKKMTTGLLEELIPGYAEVMEEGKERARLILSNNNITMDKTDMENIFRSRTRSEVFSSIGYLVRASL